MALCGTGYRKEFAPCLQRPRTDVSAAIFFVLRIQPADSTAFTGSFHLQKTFIDHQWRPLLPFSSPSRRQVSAFSLISQWHIAVRGCRKEFPRCLQMPRADVFAAIIFALRIQSANATAFQVEKTFINGTLRYGVRKGASSFDVVNFCSSPSRNVRGTERGLLVRLRRLVQFSTISRTRHRHLPSGIGTKQTADEVTCQKSINKVSTMC